MKKVLALALVALVGIAACVYAVTITNQGQVITITKLSESMAAGTASEDQSVYATPIDRRGLHVVRYSVPAAGISGTVDIGEVNLPKGSILLEDAVIEVSTAFLPANATTNALAIGGITVLATGTDLGSTGIKAAVATAGITTAADKLAITVTGGTATQGVITVYLPYIMGNAQ
jgi:hypothetical protein